MNADEETIAATGVLVAEEPFGSDGRAQEDAAPLPPDAADTPATRVPLAARDCPVAHITVFRTAAEVTRTVVLDAPHAGRYDVAVHGLPAHVLPASVRVDRGCGPATLLAVQCATERVATPAATAAKTTLQRLTAFVSHPPLTIIIIITHWLAIREHAEAKERVEDLERRIAACECQAHAVRGIAAASQSTAVPQAGCAGARDRFLSPAHLADARAFLDAVRHDVAAAATQRRTLTAAHTAAQERLAALARALAAAQGRADERAEATTVTVALAVRAAGSAVLALRYVVRGAAWAPRYDLRLDRARGTLALACTAAVRNATGEDWPAGPLCLAAADPGTDDAAPPALATVVASLARAPHAPAPRQPGEGDGDTNGAVATAAAGAGAAAATVTVHSHGTVACTGEEHTVAAFVLRDVAARTHYVVVPRAVPAAFLVVEGTGDGAHPLLPGPVAAFVDGSLVAQSTLRGAEAPHSFAVSLGADRDVRVEYTLPEAVSSDSGFFVFKKHIDSFTGKITVTNNKQGADITLRIQEQIPQTDTKGITVALQKPPKKDASKETVCKTLQHIFFFWL